MVQEQIAEIERERDAASTPCEATERKRDLLSQLKSVGPVISAFLSREVEPLAFVFEALRDPGLDPDAAWIAPPVTRAADGTLFAGQRGAIAPQSERSQLATVCAHPAAVVRAGMRPL